MPKDAAKALKTKLLDAEKGKPLEPKQFIAQAAVKSFGNLANSAIPKLGQPKLFIHELDKLGEMLRKELRAQYDINSDSTKNKENFAIKANSGVSPSSRQLVATYPELAEKMAEGQTVKLSDDAARTFHAFKVCWKSQAQADHAKRFKANINYHNRHNIHLALSYLDEVYSYDKAKQLFDLKNQNERKQAARQFHETSEAIKQYEVTKQTFMKYMGYMFASIFAITQGGSNSMSMAGAIVGFATLFGLGGLAVGAPYVAIPALIIGFGSLVINYAIGKPTTGKTFVDFFARDTFLGGLFNYRDADGNKLSFTTRQKIGYIFGGALPALFSATSLAVLGGFALKSALLGISFLAPIAGPVAYVSIVGCGLTLFSVYGKGLAERFHFDKGVSGMAAVKAYFKKFIISKDSIQGIVDANADKMKVRLLANKAALGLTDKDIDAQIAAYKSSTMKKGMIASYCLAALSLAGIGLTLVSAAFAVPAIFPAIPLAAAMVMAGVAMWGQVPFYAGASANVATRITAFFTRPSKIKELETIEAQNKKLAAKKNEAEDVNDFSKNFEASEKDRYENLSPMGKVVHTTKKGLEQAGNITQKTSQVLNPLGNGALGMFSFLGRNIIAGTAAFILGTIASASVGYSLDPQEDNNNATNKMFKRLFKGGDIPPQANANKLALAASDKTSQPVARSAQETVENAVTTLSKSAEPAPKTAAVNASGLGFYSQNTCSQEEAAISQPVIPSRAVAIAAS